MPIYIIYIHLFKIYDVAYVHVQIHACILPAFTPSETTASLISWIRSKYESQESVTYWYRVIPTICTWTHTKKGISLTPLGGMHMTNKLKKFFVLKWIIFDVLMSIFIFIIRSTYFTSFTHFYIINFFSFQTIS